MARRNNLNGGYTPSQSKALKLLNDGKNIFLTGKAGTGKSFLTREFIRSKKSDSNMLICAPTGIAALNIGGVTIHRAFGAPIGIIEPDTECRSKERLKAIDEADIVLIDEISMCRTDLFGYVARTIMSSEIRTGRSKQVVCVGDFFQLPPVLKNESHEAEAYHHLYGDSLYAFQSNSWRDLKLQTVELQEVVRQEEASFVSSLTRIRVGIPDFRVFKQEQKELASAVTITATNDKARKINEKHMRKLQKSRSVTAYISTVEGDVKPSDKVTSDTLELAPGARIIMLNNDKQGRWINGSLGTVVMCFDDGITVCIDGKRDSEYFVDPFTWKIVDYDIDKDDKNKKRLSQKEIGSFKQLPVKLAWAITIHKSQGQTYDKVNVDATEGFFAFGQMYVALSRCSSLKGLRIVGTLKEDDLKCSPEVKAFMEVDANSVAKAETSVKQLSIIDLINEAQSVYITLPSSLIEKALAITSSMPNVGIVDSETGEVVKDVNDLPHLAATTEQKPVEQHNEESPDNDDNKVVSKRLTPEQRAEKMKHRIENREKVVEQKKLLEHRNSTLTQNTREVLAGLSDRDNLVFWSIRDAGAEGINANGIVEKTGQIIRSVTNSIKALRSKGIVKFEGSKKTGKFKVVGEASKDSRCMTCRLYKECQGNALYCNSYSHI